jgi:secreted PhoX family phosphatase
MKVDRRKFLKASTSIGTGFLALRTHVLKSEAKGNVIGSSNYGPPIDDPNRILALPKGFSYTILSTRGQKMDDGLYVPGQHDGMAAFPGNDGKVVLVRNHELNPSHEHWSPFGPNKELWPQFDRELVYDPGDNGQLGGYGATTTILYDPIAKKVDRHFLSLAGTEWNCAGGPTPWGSWITCEESVSTAKGPGGYKKDHGYPFEVPAIANGKVTLPVPILPMGRFRREAIAIDPNSGIVYQTEDRHDGLIYRYIPKIPGKLGEGGRLQALVIKDSKGTDTRNWRDNTSPAKPSMPISKWLQVEWLDIMDVHSPDDSLRKQGFANGAAVFARGEGMWYGNGAVYWACTNGGPFMKGQIFRYIPSPYEGTLREKATPGVVQLYIESHSSKILENCDNLTVAPWGDLFICEDNPGRCSLVRVTKDGELSHFAENRYSKSELAGVCFSPEGGTLFVNIQKEGITLAVSGNWAVS